MESVNSSQQPLVIVSGGRRILSSLLLAMRAFVLFFTYFFVYPGLIVNDTPDNSTIFRWIVSPSMILLPACILAVGLWVRGFDRWRRILATILTWVGFITALPAGLLFVAALMLPTNDPSSPPGFFLISFTLGLVSFVVGIILRRSTKASLSSLPPQLVESKPSADGDDSNVRLEEYIKYEPLLARRATAALIDYNIFLAIGFIYLFVFGTKVDSTTYTGNGGHFAVLVLVWFIYFPVAEAIFGATLAKSLFRIRVIHENPEDAPLKVAFKRHILDLLDFFFFGAVAIVLVKVTPNHKRLGDFFAHSRVVLRQRNPVAA